MVKTKKILSLLLLLTMALGLMAPAAFAEEKVLHIKSASELAEFSNYCTMDSFSKGLTVVLDKDIDLKDVEFFPIPTFSGCFDGAGHSILNMETATNGSHQGLFRYVQEEGTVKNLNVEGSVCPDGSKNQVGGIVGVNYGTISHCSFKGKVAGTNHVGGICGNNQGSISNCTAEGSVEGKQAVGGIAGKSTGVLIESTNNAEINTTISQKGIALEELSLMDVTNLELTNAEDPDVVTDAGGIVGFSSGLVSRCENYGTVGYQHYGYNIGGIAGRQSGFLEQSKNYGKVFGRKDVGGIVGQMEPYLRLKDSVNLANEVYTLHALINNALGSVRGMGSNIEDSLQSMKDSTQGIIGGADAGTGYTNQSAFDKDIKPVLLAETEETVPEMPTLQPAESVNPNMNAVSEPEIIDPSDDPVIINPDFGGIIIDGSYQDYVDSVTDAMIGINQGISASRGQMVADLQLVNAQMSNILLAVGDILSGKDRASIEDISDKLGMEDVDGRVDSCVNYGQIEADRNVGGIAGGMGIEYEFDLEGSLSENFNKSNLLTATYQTKCVNSGNVNEGSVVGKKDNIGGICGLEELGIIRQCQGYGSIESQDGGCVGGIAGKSESDIFKCYAMCNLDGHTNIGGIAGYGTVIKECGSLVGIVDITNPCCGAIAGWADITKKDYIQNNFYVHETLGAVDGISYEGKAVRQDYKDFMENEGLPERFKKLGISYVADGEEIKKLEFTYGGSIDESLIPEVPQKEGYTGSWPEYDYSKLYFSDTVEAVYVSRQATVASEEHREDSPISIVLLEGDFPDATRIMLNPFSGSEPEQYEGEIVEKWVMRVENAGEKINESYTIRFATPDDDCSIDIYVYDGENWKPVTSGRNGSYITFNASGSEVVFCAAATEKADLTAVIIIAAVILAAVLLIVFIIRRNKKKKAEPVAAEEEAGKAEDEKNPEETRTSEAYEETEIQ